MPFPYFLADELAPQMRSRGRGELMFTAPAGGEPRVSKWRPRMLAPAEKRVKRKSENFPSVTPHNLRHTAPSLAISAGANPKAVQTMLGRASAVSTLDT